MTGDSKNGSAYDSSKNTLTATNYNSSMNNDNNVSSPLKSFHSAFEEVHSPSKAKDAEEKPPLNESQTRKLASPRRSKTKEPKGAAKNAAASATKRDLDSLQMPPPASNFTPRCVSANILQTPSANCRKRPQSEPRKRTRSDETTNNMYSVSTKRPQYNSVQDLTKSTDGSKTEAESFKDPNRTDNDLTPTAATTATTAADNPLGEMNILHLENDALLDFLGEDTTTGEDNVNNDNRHHGPTQPETNLPLMQSFDIGSLGPTSAAPPTSVSTSAVQRCANISPSTIGNRPAGMVRPTVRVAPRTENQPENNNNNNNANAGGDANNGNNYHNQNLNSSLEGHSFDDSFNYVTQQQEGYAQSNPNVNKRMDGNYGASTIYGRCITAPSPIPSHVYNGHRKSGPSPSPSPASFIGMSGPSPSPLTINDRAMNYNPHGFFEDESNNTGFSDHSDFSQSYSQYGPYGGTSMMQNQGGGNHTFTPIQPGESNVSLMNNQLEMLGIKSGDTFNVSNNASMTGGGGGGNTTKEPQSTLLKSYLVDQTNPNLCKPTATTTPTAGGAPKNEADRNNVQLVTPQHLPASEFLRNQAKMASRKPEMTMEKPGANDLYGWNVNADMDKKVGTQAPTPPSSITASPPDQRLEQEMIALCAKNGVSNYPSKESPHERPVLTPDTDPPLTPLGSADCLGVHQLGDNLLDELQGFS